MNFFQCETDAVRNQLQEKVAGMESFVGHLEEIFLTVEVNLSMGGIRICGIQNCLTVRIIRKSIITYNDFGVLSGEL